MIEVLLGAASFLGAAAYDFLNTRHNRAVAAGNVWPAVGYGVGADGLGLVSLIIVVNEPRVILLTLVGSALGVWAAMRRSPPRKKKGTPSRRSLASSLRCGSSFRKL